MDEIKPNETPLTEDDKQLGQNFGFFSLMKFAVPSIFALVFVAVYQLVDGMFIEKFVGTPEVGEISIAAVNLFYPILSLFVAAGIMLGTGGNAVVVKLLGEGKKKEADRIFSETIIFSVIVSVIISAICLIFRETIMVWLGASEINVEYLRPYYTVLSAAGPVIMLQMALGVMLIGEGRSVLAAVLLIIGGVLNCVLDWLFMAVFHWGITGAAIATAIGYAVTIFYAIYYYSPVGKSKYKIRITGIKIREIGFICFNGSSEMISNLSGGVTALFMNHIIFRFQGEIGQSALSVVLYFQFIIIAVFMGFTMAVAPVFSYHYGTGNKEMRAKVFKLSILWTAILGIVLSVLFFLFREPIVGLFFNKGTRIYELTMKGFMFAVPAALFVGFNAFASALFTAFSNGGISAFLSVLRTLIILTGMLFLLSWLFGENGMWVSWAATEAISLVVSAVFLFAYRKKYAYVKLKKQEDKK